MKICSKCKKPRGEDRVHSWCKNCINESKATEKKTKRGLASGIYTTQIQSSKKRNMQIPTYSREWLIRWLFSKELFHKLYDEWVLSGYSKDSKPSVDRKDDYISYTTENIELTTWGDNNAKGWRDTKSGKNNKKAMPIVQLSKDGIFVNEFHSQAEAQRKTGILQSNITKVCSNKAKTAGGYIWIKKENYE